MLRTILVIPHELLGIPVFGLRSWAMGIWVVIGLILAVISLRREGWTADTRGLLVTLGVFGLAIAFVLPWVEVRDETIHGLAIRGYGVFMLAGIVSGVSLAAYRGRRLGITPETVYSMALWTCVAGLAGARTFYVVTHWHQFQHPSPLATLLEILKISDGGLIVYGSIFGGMLGLLIFTRWEKLPTLELMDLAAPSLMLGVGFGRLGCLLNGCCFGGVCDAELPRVAFPFDSPAYQHHWHDGLFWGLRLESRPASAEGSATPGAIVARVVPGSPAAASGIKPGNVIQTIAGAQPRSVSEAQKLLGNRQQVALTLDDGQTFRLTLGELPRRSLPVHPVQVYSSIDGFLLCLIGLAYTPFRRRTGEVTALILALYSATRFIEEMVRDDQAGVLGTPLSIAQVVSLGLMAGVVVLWLTLPAPRASAKT